MILIGNVSNGPEIEHATSSEIALHSPYAFYECGENCGEATIKAPKGLYLLDMLAGQNILHHKPPKFLMGKQIKHLGSKPSL